MKRRAELQEADGNIDNENTKDISFKTRTPACLEQEGIQPARYSSVLPPHLPCTISAFSPHAPSLPFVQSLELSLGLGTGDGERGHESWCQLSTLGLGCRSLGGKSQFCSPATAHRCQTAAERGASPQILILNGLIVEMSCTSAQNERRALSF